MVRTTQRLLIALATVVLLAGCTAEAPNPVGETSPVAAPSTVSVAGEPPAAGSDSAARPVPTVPTAAADRAQPAP
ncbi:hypothetical protein C5C18_12590 [Rathayibacter tritici]|uniref:hypothetical protein n=1 Tax=Rathayibacter tritici TaxID=33888 RepID=UPI0008300991|nr:hypothetical protein [Rathayibacter tritici]PPF26968.1 hypothetical protein C5C06_10450 [Rathayibacter tritici]PPF65825.1 hypothetical protein C5C21_10635 [Rathayibacter tritici]PPG05360.1 hypothetical protein C5C18_12590 [Rathayibacter tritici]PPI19180.1 hypothetical protein C5D07_02305 [Rathayibacter tritici]PPI48025.1 hypothetical protein C5D18_02260 [Rathayibacter tritici]